jgi:hypothetical protein
MRKTAYEALDERSTKSTTYIDVKSEILRDILREVLRNVKTVSLMEPKPTVSDMVSTFRGNNANSITDRTDYLVSFSARAKCQAPYFECSDSLSNWNDISYERGQDFKIERTSCSFSK